VDPSVQAKRSMRVRLRTRRRERAELPGREQAAARLAAAVCSLVDDRCRTSVCRVAAYQATPTEPPTDVLIKVLRGSGHEVLLPITNPDRTLDWDLAGRRLPPDALRTAALVLTPGLAVDRSGLRLGQGGGCYDLALSHAGPGVPVVTLLWDDEFVDEPVPTEPHDRRVDAVITPGRGLVWLTSSG
jgi:5-formyltetrahydrofolate cyclo-ligase